MKNKPSISIPRVWIFLIMAFMQKVNAQNNELLTTSQPKEGSAPIKFGGYIKLDFIYDLNPIGSPDFFDVSKIPTTGMEKKSAHLNAKETFLNLEVKRNLNGYRLRGFVETDFYGANSTIRMRHAYIEVNDKWLLGQTWSNFMDENIIPPSLDFEKPAAYAFLRHPMIRYKYGFNQNTYLSLAIEEPSNNAQAPKQSGQFENIMPDITARFRKSGTRGHVQLSGFLGSMNYKYDTGVSNKVMLYGLNLSGQLKLLKKDMMAVQIVGGPGSGRYRGGMSAALDSSGQLMALKDLGFSVQYQHFWNENLYSLAVYSHGIIENTGGQDENSSKSMNYSLVNLCWLFTPKTLFGIEYLRGFHEVKSGASGIANRIQVSVKLTLN